MVPLVGALAADPVIASGEVEFDVLAADMAVNDIMLICSCTKAYRDEVCHAVVVDPFRSSHHSDHTGFPHTR